MSAIHISNEIIESQKARSDLLKWKLVVVATLGTLGLGVSTNLNKMELALCFIPMVCAYIDALCLHLNLRIYSIGQWHRLEIAKGLDPEYKYMQLYEKFTTLAYDSGAYQLEKVTIYVSSLIINTLVAFSPWILVGDITLLNKTVISVFGIIGVIFTFILNDYLNKTKDNIKIIKESDLKNAEFDSEIKEKQ